jgi:hypothetical protein
MSFCIFRAGLGFSLIMMFWVSVSAGLSGCGGG